MREKPRMWLTLMAIATAAVFFTDVATAQECLGVTEGTTIVSSPEITIIPDDSGPIGDNYLEIPAFSEVNNKPTNPSQNGFQQLCEIFGLKEATSEILQIDPENGIAQTFHCGQAIAPDFLPCHGVRIRTTEIQEPVSGYIPIEEGAFEGVEGSWTYPIWTDDPGSVKGDHIFGIPLTIVDTNPDHLCEDFKLSDPGITATVTWVDPVAGKFNTHRCGSLPVWSLTPGSAVIIKSNVDSLGTVPID